MLGNQSDKNTNPQNNNPAPGLFGTAANTQNKPATSGLFGSSTGGLFGSTTTPSGGLFSLTTPSTGGLFGNTNTSNMKTSERKEGGLFANSSISKPPSNDEAPKLLFGGIGGNQPSSSLFGTGSNASTEKKDQNTGSLFGGKPPGYFFGNPTSTPSPNFFGNTPNQTKAKQDEKKPEPSGLFQSVTQEKKQTPDTNKQKPTLSFGNTSGSLFGNTPAPSFGQKKQTGGLFGNTGGSTLFSGLNQGPSLFGASTKKQEDKKEPSVASSNNGPSTPLFAQKAPTQNAPVQQKPSFSLAGGITSTPIGSGGLFGKKQPELKPAQHSKAQAALKEQKPEAKPAQTPLFNLPETKDETKKIAQPTFGTGGLFGAQKVETKPTESSSSGLFGNSKKETPPVLTGGLFGSNTDQSKPKENTGTSSLFGGSTSLFAKQTPKNEPKVDQTKPLTTQTREESLKLKEVQSNENLLATFSRQKINEASTVGQTVQNFQKRPNRGISFDGPLNLVGEGSPSNVPAPQAKPAVSGGLFSNTLPTPTANENKKDSMGIGMTESVIKPSTGGMAETVPPTSSSVSKSQKMMQETFFKPVQTPKKQPASPTIWTAFEINNLLKEEILKKSMGPSRYGERPQKNFTKNIEEWIEISFTRFNQVPTSEQLQKKFALHSNEDINRFLNDIVREVVLVANLPIDEKSFKLVNKLFFELLDKLGIKEYLFNCTKVQIPQNQAKNLPPSLQIVQLNTSYFTKHQIYKFTAEGILLNLDSEELQKYIVTLTKKFITNQLEYLEYIQNKTEMLKLPSRLFYNLLTYCLQYKKIRLVQSNVWRERNPNLIGLVQDFEKKIITKIVSVLSGFVDSTFYDFLLINKQYLPEFIQLVENFSYTEEEEIIHLSLKVILNNLGLGASGASGKQEIQLNPQLVNLIKETKSLQLLPFRTLAAIHENKGYRTSPSAHDLYRYINGPEWLDWLEIYLGNNSAEKEISLHEAKYIIKILKYPIATTKRITREKISPKQARYMQSIESRVLNRKKPIYKYIISLKEENLLNIFYEILMSIVYDYESYRKVEEIFFKQKDEFNYEFRNVIAEICNYPTQRFREEIPFLEEKVLYFLRIVEVAPERTLALEKLVFEGTPMTHKKTSLKDETLLELRDEIEFSEVGHKICHLIIDTINYFGLKNNQKIVSKCISAVKSLLENDETSLSMKIAMAVNKPEMLFISSSLLAPNQYRLVQSLVVEMTELLQFMLISEEFPQTLALSLYTNNSDDVHLERMYSVRYSNKDYLPFVRELTRNHFDNKKLAKNQADGTKITITFSSYWILKCLEVLVQGFRQEKTTATVYGKNLLYMLSLILEKFFIPISHQVQYQDINTKMMEESIEKLNNPIYSTSSSGEIPKVLLYLAETLNTIDIMSVLSENLKYKLLNTGQTFESKGMTRNVKYCLANEKLEEDYEENEFAVYLSVKILKQILQVYRVYEQFKHAPLKVGSEATLESAENHFVYKLLTRFKWIQDVEFNLFLKGFSKTDILQEQNNSTTNLIIGLITLLMDNGAQDKSNSQIEVFETTPLNLKEHNYKKPFVVPIESSSTLNKKSSTQLSNFNQVQNFYRKYGQTLNFESINNFLINPTNMYLESYQSLECLVIQSLELMVSGEALFGTRACNTGAESSVNLARFIGFYSSLEVEVFSDMWLLENFESQLYCLLYSKNTSLQLKQAIFGFLYQVIKNQSSNNNFIIAKKVFYKYLVRHLDQFSYYSDDEINRLNVIVIKILNLLEEKDYFIMRKQCNDRLIDILIGSMLRSCQKCLKSAGNLLKLIRSFNSKVYYPTEFAYYHLERTYEEREIIKTGEAYDVLKGIIELVEKRFFDKETSKTDTLEIAHKWKCIRKINSLVIDLNLPYIGATINDSKLSQLSIKHIHQEETNKYYFNANLPHSFGKNPCELYLAQAKTLSYIEVAFDAYKQNVVDWLSFASMRLGERILKFLNWILTVDGSLYGNQPIVVKSKQLLSPKEQSIVCSMHMGSYRHTAVQLFAQTQNEAINLVKTLFDESLRNLEKGMTVSQSKCFSIMGYCLEWIRAREKTEDILEHLVRNTIRNPFWINQNTLRNHFVIKFILSLVNIGAQTLDSHEFKHIHRPIFDMIQKFRQGKSQLEQSLIQEMFSILISIPPQLQDTTTIHQIVNIWRTETNNEYFYNQCRLVLELCEKYPNQIAKIKALRNCEKIKKAVSTSHYTYNLRFPDSISLIWGLKIASTLMSSEIETVLIFEQITEFYNMKNEQIYNLLLRNTSTTLSLVHIEELQALLEFILTLVSSQSWVTVHRKQFEKLTYVLSHKLINLFMDFINSKITFVAESDMEKRFKKIKYQSYTEQLKEQVENHVYETGIEKNSVFRMFAELKMIECIKTFILVLSRCFQQSWYVHKYFNEQVYENYRYGVSFWDRMNKCIMDLIRFNINVEKKWKKSQNLNQKLLLIQDCLNSSEFFVETGYLSSIYSVPLNSRELFQEFEELNRISLELGNVHLIQEKTFRLKYQCLMKGNIQKFGKKLMENAKVIQDQAEQQEFKPQKVRNLFLENFSKNLANLIKTV